MNYKLILSLALLVLVFTSQSASAFLPLQGSNIIIQQITGGSSTGKQGTYNQTLANNVVINKNGFKINFLNGTNNPINIVNDTKRNQVNVTIADSAGGGGVTSLNALSGALTIVCVSGNTTCTSGVTTITVNTAWNVVTTGLSAQTITKALTLNQLILGGTANGNNNHFTGINNLNATKVFQGSHQVIDTLVQSTGISITGSGNSRTVASTVTDTNTAQISNADGATIGLFGTHPNATKNTIKTLSKTGCITLSDNGTNIQIGCTTGGVNSLNFTTSSDFDFNIKPRNMSMITLDGTVFNFKLKPNILLANESSQIVTKQLTLNQGILGGNLVVTGFGLSNGGHISSPPTTTGTLCQTNQTSSCGTNSGVKALTVIGSGTGNATTGNILLTTKTYQNNTGSSQTPGLAEYSGMSGSALQFRGVVCGAGMSCSTNATSLRVNSTATGTVTSVTGTANNVTSTGGTTPVINLGSNVVTTGGSAQTISKGMTLAGANNFFTGSNDFHDGGTTTEKFDSNDIVIRNPVATFGTTLNNVGITANRTLNLPLTTGTDTLAALGVVQIWTAKQDFGGPTDNIDIFDDTGIVIRNDAHTFANLISQGAITKNITTNTGVPNSNVQLSYQPIFNFTSPANKTGTASLTPVMLGAFATLTPRYSTNATVSVSGYTTDGTLLDGCKLDIRTGTGGLGANGAVLQGTKIGSNFKSTSATASAKVPFSKTVIYTGLVVGTKQYFDLSFGADIGGTCTVFNVDWAIREQ